MQCKLRYQSFVVDVHRFIGFMGKTADLAGFLVCFLVCFLVLMMSWPKPSFTLILVAIFTAWLINSLWSIYQIFNPKECHGDGSNCLHSSWKVDTPFIVFLCVSTSSRAFQSPMNLIHKNEKMFLSATNTVTTHVTLPASVVHSNSSLFLHVILTSLRGQRDLSHELLNHRKTVHSVGKLIKFMPKRRLEYSLLQDKKTAKQVIFTNEIIQYWNPKVVVDVGQPQSLDRNAVPGEISHLIHLTSNSKTGNTEYLPIVYVSDVRTRVKEFTAIESSKQNLPLTVVFEPSSLGKLRFMVIAETSLKTMHSLGFSEFDTDDVKGIFFDTNLFLLLLTVLVTSCHILFDFLAFKSDIYFWKDIKSMTGLSLRSLIWRSVSQVIISLYLYDQGTSSLVLIPAVVAALIEFWKLSKAWKMSSNCNQAILTDEYDSTFMRYLSNFVLYPLLICGSAYSLVYSQHKSWTSWAIESAANGVYAFGFLFMLPQLFINYKLKSVAHLPWKPFMYKAFNTFIDDLFALILTSIPTSHRVAAFRDDIVFLIYLYQRYLYPVDKSRAEGEDETKKEK